MRQHFTVAAVKRSIIVKLLISVGVCNVYISISNFCHV